MQEEIKGEDKWNRNYNIHLNNAKQHNKYDKDSGLVDF